MKVYLASRFSRRHECHALAKELIQHGHTITSRWVKAGEDHVIPVGMSEQAADAERRRFAVEDCEDVHSCDWMISLMEEPRSNGRGGRHVEFGMALALEKRLTIIGPRETVFHHLDEVEHFETVEAFLISLS
jgi:nucleoside 2-deoxyribosyltransferase